MTQQHLDLDGLIVVRLPGSWLPPTWEETTDRGLVRLGLTGTPRVWLTVPGPPAWPTPGLAAVIAAALEPLEVDLTDPRKDPAA